MALVGVPATCWAWRLSFIVMATLPGSNPVDDRAVRDSFRAQYGPHAATVEGHYSNVEFKIGATPDDGVEGKYDRLHYIWAFDEPILPQKGAARAADRVVEVRNPMYLAMLRQGPGGPYVVTKLEAAGVTKKLLLCRLCFPYADTLVAQESFLDLIDDPSARFVSFEDAEWDGRPIKELRVDYTLTNPSDGKSRTYGMRYDFSPQEGWVCRRVRSATESFEEERTCHYGGADVYPPIRRLENHYKRNRPTTSESRWVAEVTEFNRRPPFPESDFTLAAFGLPEPGSVTPAPRSMTWLWLIVAALGIGAMGGLFSWLKRRSMRAASA